MKYTLKEIKSILSGLNDSDVIDFVGLSDIIVTTTKSLLSVGNKEPKLFAPADLPHTITDSDILEFLNIAKSIYSATKKLSDGIPYGMLKRGVDFKLDKKLFEHFLLKTGNAVTARTLKTKVYRELLVLNEQYWK